MFQQYKQMETMMNTISTDNTHLVDVIFIVSTMGVPPVIIQILVGFSRIFQASSYWGIPVTMEIPHVLSHWGYMGFVP